MGSCISWVRIPGRRGICVRGPSWRRRPWREISTRRRIWIESSI